MSQLTDGEQPGARPERAGLSLRLWGCVLGLGGLGLGMLGLFGLPESCRVIGYIAAGLFIPVSVWVLFISLRGRRSDLRPLSPSEMADTAATTATGRVVDEIIDKLS